MSSALGQKCGPLTPPAHIRRHMGRCTSGACRVSGTALYDFVERTRHHCACRLRRNSLVRTSRVGIETPSTRHQCSPCMFTLFDRTRNQSTAVVTARVEVGTVSHSWNFIIIDQAPYDMVVGLDLIRNILLYLDPHDLHAVPTTKSVPSSPRNAYDTRCALA